MIPVYLTFDKESGTYSPVALNIQVTCAPLENLGMRGVFLLIHTASLANNITLRSGLVSPWKLFQGVKRDCLFSGFRTLYMNL